jgi:hypothetical protein
MLIGKKYGRDYLSMLMPRSGTQNGFAYEIMIRKIWFKMRSHWPSGQGKTDDSEAGTKTNIQT